MDKLQPGQMLGPYQIIEQIGEGGMATVYKAYQPSMDRNVAIKVLPSQLADSAEFTKRFQQEARIIAKLEHPHILPVFDYGESEGITYLVMRYLDAGTLGEKMQKECPLPLAEIDRLFTQLAEALGYAHSYGIIHRDLKPSNALIDSQGNLFLTDFGIAKMLESASPRLTQTDAIMGTPAYISPEQAQATKVNQRSDIYSLGIILYEMVTGRVPFIAETPLAVILKHVSDPLPKPSVLKLDVPEAIEKVVLRALEKQPSDRYATVDEFLSAWKRALDESKMASRPATDTIAAQAAPEIMLTNQPNETPVSNAQQSVPTPKTTSNSRGWIGWVAGCFIILCLFLVVGGGAYYLYSSGVFASTPPTQTPAPTQTQAPAPTDEPRPTDIPQATEAVDPAPTGEIILDDDFSDDSIWGLLDETTAAIEYDSEQLRMRVFEQNWIVWSTPNGEYYENIHTEVTAINNDGESTTAFGIMCYQQDDGDSYYYGVVTPAGEYAIAIAQQGESDVFLTNNDQWGSSDLIDQNQDSYRVGLDCYDGILSLYVDGQLIDTAYDDTYTSGSSGLIIWSGEDVSSADVSFDDFIVESIE